eukprot:m.142564 g.142564  ORF g.142564 m.142564 type:complete len:318 (+) comp10038_c0_seq1:220-1173(+)
MGLPLGAVLFAAALLLVGSAGQKFAPDAGCRFNAASSTIDCAALNLQHVPTGLSLVPPDNVQATALTLAGNNIGGIPKNIFNQLTQLETLDLDNNLITTINVDAFIAVTTLTTLDLSNGRLTSFDGSQLSSTIEQLLLSNNSITSIPLQSFSSLTNLKTLTLYNNPLENCCSLLHQGSISLQSLAKVATAPSGIAASSCEFPVANIFGVTTQEASAKCAVSTTPPPSSGSGTTAGPSPSPSPHGSSSAKHRTELEAVGSVIGVLVAVVVVVGIVWGCKRHPASAPWESYEGPRRAWASIGDDGRDYIMFDDAEDTEV